VHALTKTDKFNFTKLEEVMGALRPQIIDAILSMAIYFSISPGPASQLDALKVKQVIS
jgi:hypothetical protein